MRGRLTVEIGIALTLALGLITAWNAWQMQQILIATHTKNITQIAARFPRDVEIYTEMLQIEPSLKKTIDNVFDPKLLIWVKDNQGKLIAHSDNFQPELPTNRELISFASMPHQPQIYQLGERYVVLCEGNITIRSRQVGTVYLARDSSLKSLNDCRSKKGMSASYGRSRLSGRIPVRQRGTHFDDGKSLPND